MAITVYKKTGLTGGTSNDLDGIDGAGLLDADMAFVTVNDFIYTYILDDDSAESEASPEIISPDSNAGNKRWILQEIATSSETKTNDYTVTTRDIKKLIILGSATSADKTFTLPSVDSTNDSMVVNFINDSDYTLTIQPSDSDSVWNSGAGYGIEILDKGTGVWLRYDHSRTKWDIIGKWGGRVIIEGLVLHEKCSKIYLFEEGATGGNSIDESMQQTGQHTNDVNMQMIDTKFPPCCFNFPGNDEYIIYADPGDDVDIGKNQTGCKTVAFWAYFNDSGNERCVISHYEDSSNSWSIKKMGTDIVRFLFRSGASNEILIDSTTTVNGGWHHVAIVFSGADVGLYIDGVQEAHTDSWNTDSFAGHLYVGQTGATGNYHKGYLQDLHVSWNNPYNASPNSTPDDSFTEPTTPFVGVM